MADRSIDYLPIDDIPQALRNAKQHKRDKITGSIRKWGFTAAPIIDERTGRLVAGHGRLEALRWMRDAGESPPEGIHTDGDTWLAPVERGWSSRSDADAEALTEADNNLTELGGWDQHLRAEILEDIADHDPDLLDAAGWEREELDQLLNSIATEGTHGTPDEDEAPEPSTDEDAITKPGDLWILGNHRLLCGDATNEDDVKRLINGEHATLMATDPPYLVDYQGGNHPQSWHNKTEVKDKHWDDYTDPDQASDFFYAFLTVARAQALTDRPAIYQWHAAGRADLVMDAWKRAGLLAHQQIIWVKARAVLGRSHFMWQHEPCLYGWIEGNQPDQARRPPSDAKTVWEIDQKGDTDGIHPTQKPVEVIRRPVEWHTRPNEVIYEPFGGSGTALIAAEQTGRACYAIELSPAFCDVILQRWASQTGRTPVHADTGQPLPGTAS